jgi:cardiolipin synthase
MWRKQNIPNTLTYFRIAVIPLLLLVYYIPGFTGHALATILFILAGITDYLDGYFARNWNVQSKLGRFLDPIADKLLVVAVLVVLIDANVLHGWHLLPTLAILCREILVSGLREHLAELQVHVPVSQLAKWKTAIQLTALGMLLFGPYTPGFLGGEYGGLALLWAAATLTVYTGYNYLHYGLKHF